MSLRIAQVAPIVFPIPPIDHGGTERIVYDLTEALVSLGHDVTLFASSDSKTSAKLISALPSLAHFQSMADELPPGVAGVLEVALMEQLRRHQHEFDIIHCHGEFFHAALLGARRRNTLTTIHWRVDELDRQLFFSQFPGLPVAAISYAQAVGIPPSNCMGVVHHGLAPERFPFRPGQYRHGKGGYLAFIGRLTDQKRPDRAIAIARRAGKPLRIAGTIDVGNPRYFDEVVRPELGDAIQYIGALNDRHKTDFLGHAQGLLFPIDWPEPFGLVMIEAMACGTPVIAWRRGAVAEIIEHGVTGFIVENLDDAVEAVARLETLDRAVIQRRFLERFTSRRMAEDYLTLYASCLGDS